MYSFNFTTQNPATGERTTRTVRGNVYNIDALYEVALSDRETVSIDPRP